MKITKNGVDAVIATGASIASAVIPVLITEHAINSHTGELIGSIVAAVVAGYHGSAKVSNIQSNKDANTFDPNANLTVNSSSAEPGSMVIS